MITYLSVGALKNTQVSDRVHAIRFLIAQCGRPHREIKAFLEKPIRPRFAVKNTKRYAALEIYARVDVSSGRPAEEVVMKWKAMTPVSSLVIN